MSSDSHGMRLLHVVGKHVADIVVVQRALKNPGLTAQHKQSLEHHLAWLRGGPLRRLPLRTLRFALMFAGNICSVPNCQRVGVCESRLLRRTYCKKHRHLVAGEIAHEREFKGYEERSNDIAEHKVVSDGWKVRHGINRNSGTVQRVRRS